MRTIYGLLFAMVAVLPLSISSGVPQDQDVFTDFEGITSTDFTIGTAPEDAHFTGGSSAFLGILELYHSGSFGWMVDPGQTGLIEFQTNAIEVEFYARTRSLATQPSVLTAFNDAGSPIDNAVLNAVDGWQLIKFTGSIDHITYQNQDLTQMNAIDDFGYTVPGLPGDFDTDSDVDGVDFGLWQTGYPTASGAVLGDGDADGDGDVDGVDFGIWQVNYPTNVGAATVTTIPEPATLTLLLVGSFLVGRRRRSEKNCPSCCSNKYTNKSREGG